MDATLGKLVNTDNPTLVMRFRSEWRPYQQRVLDSIRTHLVDRRLHIVAAPGAGKTTLGLEVFRWMGKPALVLAPSRTIRDQWVNRLRDFLPDGVNTPEWAGTSLDGNTFFTAITYQALHTLYRQDAEEEDAEESDDSVPSQSELEQVIAHCRALGIGTVILDEAHHLRQEWWRVLSSFTEALGEVVLISLTATPPYDVIGSEWRRYADLCGPIDDEISVPELVRAGTLCPHQDYLWACPPSAGDVITARQHDEAVSALMRELAEDQVLLDAVRQHPWLASEAPDEAAVLDDPEFAVSAIALLKLHAVQAPAALCRLLDCRADELPKMDRRWWAALLQRYLFVAEWPESTEDHRTKLARRMRQLGLLYRRELRLVRHAGLASALSQSSAKIEACVAINRLERRVRGEALRQVVLTDFIRDGEPDRLGAWPVFRRLVLSIDPQYRATMALLTGSFAVAAEAVVAPLSDQSPDIVFRPEPDLPGYLRFTAGARATQFLTDMLSSGRVQTLVGTRALLGEGWDCPPVNSLVLASFVGSFMTTNQMRGRAIRVDRGNPDKVASVWHLVAVDTNTESGRYDLEQLEERFESFSGLHSTQLRIEAGLPRLDMPPLRKAADLDEWNTTSTQRLEAMHTLARRWHAAVELGTEHRVVAAVESSAQPKMRSLVFANTLKYLLLTVALGYGSWMASTLRGLRWDRIQTKEQLYFTIAALLVIGLLFSLPRLLKCAWIGLRHLPVDGSLKQIGWAVLDGLLDSNAITTARARLSLRCVELQPGRFSLALVGGTFFESSLFADSLAAVLGPIENPRYLITRSGGAFWPWGKRDYHAVPPTLSGNKETAEQFARHWRRRVGSGELIFTRNAQGRKQLLRARVRALSSLFTEPTRRRDRWC